MRQWFGIPVAGALLLSACVTINVYFPAADVEATVKRGDKVRAGETVVARLKKAGA